MLLANLAPDFYEYHFTSDRCAPAEPPGVSDHGPETGSQHRRRRLFAGDPSGGSDSTADAYNNYDDHSDDHGGGHHGACHEERWLLLDCPLFGHPVTLHFVANDLIMAFHFGLAMKEITEAFLPGRHEQTSTCLPFLFRSFQIAKLLQTSVQPTHSK